MLQILTVHSALIFSFISITELGMDPCDIDSPPSHMYLATSKQVFKPRNKLQDIRQLHSIVPPHKQKLKRYHD